MKIPVWYDQISRALYRGGFADVWKGRYRDQDVAVKVLRTYSNSDLGKIIGVSYRFYVPFPHTDALTRPRVEVL